MVLVRPMTDNTAMRYTNGMHRTRFRLAAGPFPALFRPNPGQLALSGRTSGVKGQQPTSRLHQIRQPEQREELRRVLRQPSVSSLAVAKQVLHHMEGVLHSGPDARLGLFDLFPQLPQGSIRQRGTLAAL